MFLGSKLGKEREYNDIYRIEKIYLLYFNCHLIKGGNPHFYEYFYNLFILETTRRILYGKRRPPQDWEQGTDKSIEMAIFMSLIGFSSEICKYTLPVFILKSKVRY